MDKNPYYNSFKDKPDGFFLEIINNPKSYKEDALLAAIELLRQRNIPISDMVKGLEIEAEKSKRQAVYHRLKEAEERIPYVEIIRSSFKVWLTNLKPITISLILPYLLFRVFIELNFFLDEKSYANISDFKSLAKMSFPISLYNIFEYIFLSVAILGVFNLSLSKFRSKDVEFSFENILRSGVRFWLKNIKYSLLSWLNIFIYTLLFFLPGVYKAVQLFLVDCIVVDEEENESPLKRSIELVYNKWWVTFATILISIIINILVAVIIMTPVLFFNSVFLANILSILVTIILSYFIVFKVGYYEALRQLKKELKLY